MPRRKLATPNYRLRLRGETWVIDWTDNSATPSKTRSVSTGQSERAAADEWLAQYIAGRENPEPPKAPTIAAILDGYLDERRGHVEAFKTLEHAANAIKRHIGPLAPHHIKRRTFWQKRKTDGVSDGTIIREGVTLRAALAWAQREKWIADAPYIALPQRPAPRDRWLSREEADRLVAAAKSPHIRLFLLLALHTGARRGAILDLQWPRVDLQRRLIHFNRSGRVETKKRRATVPINATLYAALAEAQEVAATDWVIEFNGDRVGSPKKAFERAVKRAGVVPCTPHTLRHTAATWMVLAGVKLAQVARFLGDSEAMVEKVYGKHSPDYLREAADALDGDYATPDSFMPGNGGKQRANTGIDEPEQKV